MTPKQRIELRIAEINEKRGAGMPSAESAEARKGTQGRCASN